MRDQRPAGAQRRVLDLAPLSGIVKGPEDDAADQREPALGERIAEDGGILGHEADRPELHADIAGGPGLVEHARPRRVAGIVGEFDAPGTRGIADRKLHSGLSGLVQALAKPILPL